MSKPFIHLRCLSSYSLSESTLKIKKLVSLAKKNKLPALAITDNNNMFGVFEFAQECVSCLLYTSPSPRDGLLSRMPSSA